MNDLELIALHVEAVHRWRVAKRRRRRLARDEKCYEDCARRLRQELAGVGITVTLEKPKE